MHYQGWFQLSLNFPVSLFKNKTKKKTIISYLETNLKTKFFSEEGFILKISNITQVLAHHQSTTKPGFVFIEAIYEYLGYKIDTEENSLGKIHKILTINARPVLNVISGPISVDIHPSSFSDNTFKYDPIKNIFFSRISKKSLEIGDSVRFKILEKSERIHKKTGELKPFLVGTLKGLLLGKI